MAGKASKSKGKKKTQKKKAPKQPATQLSSINPALLRNVCSLTNPFCDVAKGARWPDNSHTKSVGYSYEKLSVVATDSGGNFSCLFPVGIYPLVSYGSVDVSGNATYSAPVVFEGITPPAGAVRWRVTSYGFKVSCISTRMNTQGLLRLRLLSPMDGTSLASVPVGTPYGDLSTDEPLSRFIEKDMFVTLNPLGTEARLFRPTETIAGSLANWNNPGWQVLQLSISGGQSEVPCVSVTVYANYEYVFDDASPLQLMASPPPQNNLVAAEASASVISRIGGFIEGTAKTVDNVTKSSVFKFLAPLAARASGGLVAGRAAALMISDHASRSHAIEID